jgi:hypothetical protein
MAKKQLSRDQKRKQKKQKRPRSKLAESGERLVKRMRRQGLDAKFIRNPAGQVKMSDVLHEFIDPWIDMARTEDEMRKLLSTALVAWNTALLPAAERPALLSEFTATLPPELAADFDAVIREMIERKDRHFSQIRRKFLAYELVPDGDDYHISVMSTLPADELGQEDADNPRPTPG